MISDYLGSVLENELCDVSEEADLADPNIPFRFLRFACLNSKGETSATVRVTEPFVVQLEYEITDPISDFRVGVIVRNCQDIEVFVSTDCDASPMRGKDRTPGRYLACVEVPANLLGQGKHAVTAWGAITYQQHLRFRPNALTVNVQYHGWMTDENRSGFAVNPKLNWETTQVSGPAENG